MTRTITPEQHARICARLHATQHGKCSAKPERTQAHSVRLLMEQMRRRLRAPDPRQFPGYSPGMSTADYVARYEALNPHAGKP